MSDPATCSLEASAAIARASTTSQTTSTTLPPHPLLPPISPSRLQSSLTEQTPQGEHPPDPSTLRDASSSQKTYLYLAYGSNLAAATFQGVRGIKPLAALNVVVPSLVLTFDLAGFPYSEPCFANTAYRSEPPSPPYTNTNDDSEKSPLLPPQSHTDPTWPKGLIGVVYEVTPADFAHIIATEGGGASYHDVLVSCHPLPPASSTVPSHPSTPPFKCHTLFAPNAHRRPHPGYAQPSRRYLNLLITGAQEHALPSEYRAYLDELQAYTITTKRQKVAKMLLSVTWVPILQAVFMLSRVFSDKQGKSPGWLVRLLGLVFMGVWATYDGILKGLFGDGERTMEEEERTASRRRLVKKRRGGVEGKKGWVDDR
ncbi:MAG: hypothetical protein Q9169_004478 [Polycauliona sp. 2 TL-2023]